MVGSVERIPPAAADSTFAFSFSFPEIVLEGFDFSLM